MRLFVITSLALACVLATSAGQKTDDRIRRVEAGLIPVDEKGQPTAPTTLAERMRHYKVPGVSIAVINEGRVEWALGYGTLEVGGKQPVTNNTLFQSASISKPIAAIAALQLVEEGKLNLDEDVNQKLTSWKVPENEFTRQEKVTLRGLLTHTAGVTVSGLRGYAVNEQVPSLLQILDGIKPANSAPIRVDTIPGTTWRYSGGGFLVLQQLLIDVTRQPFPQLMRDRVLKTLDMRHSTFQQPLPETFAKQAARGHDVNGETMAGGWFIYPEMAAGGLWSTPSDLARIAIAVQQAKSGKPTNVLSMKMANEMLSGQMKEFPVATVSARYGREITNQGLGFRLEGTGRAARFSHHGGNVGYTCFIVAYSETGQGAIVMTNSDNGREFIQEIVRSIAKEYAWQDYPYRRWQQ